jgi:coenzyme F420-dependent glucose-6-phosphate dehydrogenase
MPIIGYHASHEQFAPSQLLAEAQAAHAAGFATISSSDHFLPWSNAQGQSGFAWSWLGAAMQAVPLPFGVVSAPGYRYHPAVLAQAAATLGEMFPARLWVALGSGERLNEHITGEAWPTKPERNARLRECVDVMRALWHGESVSHRGRIVVEDVRLHSRPAVAPNIMGAALTPETARWVAGWADGLITVNQPRSELRALVDAFRDAGGDGKPMYLQVKVSYAKSDDEAKAGAHVQWRTCVFDSDVMAELKLPDQFEAAAAHVRREDVEKRVHCSADPQRHAAWLCEYAELGFSQLHVHNVNRGQRAFIDAYGEHVLPAMARG